MKTFGDKLIEIRNTYTNETEIGSAFEQLIMVLARTEADWGIREIWRWSDWPDRKEKTGLGPSDIGVDLIAQSVTGEFIAIQCKCYENTRVRKGDLDSFFSFSKVYDKSIDKLKTVFELMWVVTTGEWTKTADVFVRAQGAHFKRVDFIEYEEMEYPSEPGNTRNVRQPFDFQWEAIESCVHALHYQSRDRGRLIMACGTGKTFVALRIVERLSSLISNRLVLFLAPSIALVSQARREWLRYSHEGLLPLVVCSDQKAGGGDEDICLTEIKAKVTTDPEAIASFANLESDQLKVIFCTYQSLDKVARAQRDHEMPVIGITIADEAHRTTGVVDPTRNVLDDQKGTTNFRLMHDEEYLKSSKRLYMTATPRVYDARSVEQMKGRGYEVIDMGGENADTYGVELYRIGFGEAVAKKRLSQYRVIVLGVSESAVTPGLRQRSDATEWEGSANAKKPEIRELVRVLGTSLAVNGVYKPDRSGESPVPLRKVLAYSNTIPRSKWYSKILNDSLVKSMTSKRMRKDQSALKIRTTHIDGSSNADVRTKLLRELDHADNKGETHIVSNVKLFTEGVDVPSLDAIVFLDPRDSQVDVVQAVGRVMRKAEGKQFGYIVIPVILNDQGDWLSALETSAEGYQTIGRVLRALQAHDSRLAEEPENLVWVFDSRENGGKKPPKEEPRREKDLLNLSDCLQKVDQTIFAKVVATSRLGKPGKMTADTIERSVKFAASVFRRNECTDVLADQLQITVSRDPTKREIDSDAVATIAALLLCNACLMHKRLKTTVPEMQALTSLIRLNTSSEPIGELLNQWHTILEKDYLAIFAPAIAVLQALKIHGFTDNETHEAIHPLIECANEVADSLSELGYDHAGPLYHQVLPSAQSDGAFYTNNLSALMLARLTFHDNYLDWTDLESIKKLRIMDPACGTGTLLLATAKTLKDRIRMVNPGVELTELHQHIVENVVCGLDINHHAIQLAASNLTLGAPTVDYERINVARVKHGVPNEHTGLIQLGSLELLDMNIGLVDGGGGNLDGLTQDFASLNEFDSETASGGSFDFPHKDLDVVIMNPPFTNNEKRGEKFSKDVQEAMRERERHIKERLAKTDLPASIAIKPNSIQTFFTPLADTLVNREYGTVSFVAPTTTFTGSDAKGQRQLIIERFDLDIAVTSHDPSTPNFSENTSITESLVVLRRKGQNDERKPRFINLKVMPKTVEQAIDCSDAILQGDVERWGGCIEWDNQKLELDDWCACLFLNSKLAYLASEMRDDTFDGFLIKGAFSNVDELAFIEPAGQGIRGAFGKSSEFSKSRTNSGYVALWEHKSNKRKTLRATPDFNIVPKNGKDVTAEGLWQKRSRLLIANRVDTKNVRTCAVMVDQPVLGSAWIPVRPKVRNKYVRSAWCVYLNCSWNILQMLALRSKKLTYGQFSLEHLRSLKLPDPATVDLELLDRVFKSLKNKTILPWSKMDLCPVRKEIDEACARACGLDVKVLEEIRNLIVQEPTVNPLGK